MQAVNKPTVYPTLSGNHTGCGIQPEEAVTFQQLACGMWLANVSGTLFVISHVGNQLNV